MDRNRRIAVIVGALYIVGTVSGILSVVLSGPLMNAPDYLGQIAAHPGRLILAALCVLTMGLSLAMVPVVIHPVLRKHDESLALGYVVARGALEPITYIGIVLSQLALISVAREVSAPGGTHAIATEAIGTVITETGSWIGEITTVVFILGAVMFYSVLYRSRLVPRWISGWGLIAAVPYLAAGILVMFGSIDQMSTADALMRIPLGLQEMVLAVWLIARGFNREALAAQPA